MFQAVIAVILIVLVAESHESCTFTSELTSDVSLSIDFSKEGLYPNDPGFYTGSGVNSKSFNSRYLDISGSGCSRDVYCYGLRFQNGTLKTDGIIAGDCLFVHIGGGDGPRLQFRTASPCDYTYTEVFQIRWCSSGSSCSDCRYTNWITLTKECVAGQNTISKTGEAIEQWVLLNTATPSNTVFTFPTFVNSFDGCGYQESTLVLQNGDSALMDAIDTSSIPWTVSPLTLND